MEGIGVFGFRGVGAVMKKRRSATPRRPWPDSSLRRKEFYLNDPAPRISSVGKPEGVPASRKIKKDGTMFGGLDGFYGKGSSRNDEQGSRGSDLKYCNAGESKSSSRTRESFRMESSSPNGYLSRNDDGHDAHHSVGDLSESAENKLRKVKLKVGGVTHTLHAKSNEETGHGGPKPLRSSDASQHRQKLINQDYSGPLPEKGSGLQGVQWKSFSSTSFSREGKEDSHGKVTDERSRKSNRLPKKRVLDDEFNEGEEDEEIRYLERLRISKVSTNYTRGSKSRNTAYDVDEDYGLSWSTKDSRKKSQLGKESKDYVEEEKPGSGVGLESESKKQKTVFINSATDFRTEPLTTRHRALQSGKGGTGASLIEFPNGLPPPLPRKQKEKPSEEEQQAKKAEAAQRRKLQMEKQAKEIEEEAIRKILGLDSDRKKEEKKQKERDEKAAKSLTSASNAIRWIMGPTGTIVTFPKDVGLPSIFDSKPCCYPPPREKCAGPSCTNPYKYRDSRSNLPLCSLQCYKAVQGSVHSVTC